MKIIFEQLKLLIQRSKNNRRLPYKKRLSYVRYDCDRNYMTAIRNHYRYSLMHRFFQTFLVRFSSGLVEALRLLRRSKDTSVVARKLAA